MRELYGIGRTLRTFAEVNRSSFILCAAIGAMTLAGSASAATYTVLHSFAGRPNDGAYDGSFPNGNLFKDKAGNLFGTTIAGGPYDLGTIFKIDPTGNYTLLVSFNYKNGAGPMTGLSGDRKHLYATTNWGGLYGGGAVVAIGDQGHAHLRYSFCSLPNCTDGDFVQYGVTRDSAGNLYGTTQSGGAYGNGVVFKADRAGSETVLYSFCPGGFPCSDGWLPLMSGVVRDLGGNLYGVANAGGNINCAGTGYPCGVVWKLDASGNETVLHAFTGAPSDGHGPVGNLAFDRAGNLYGVTQKGGSGTACGSAGCGTLFKVEPNGTEKVLYNFTGSTDGSFPGPQALVLDKKGNLYGTASSGGRYGNGTVFKLHTSGKLTVLYSFQGQSDGGQPGSGLLRDKSGVLYGETNVGGDLNCSKNPGVGCGVVFKITTP